MRSSARQSAILEAVVSKGSCSVAELADRHSVSGETIRRDLKRLAAAGLVRKVHGGATVVGPLHEASYQQRMRDNAEAKQRIARLAARQVRDGETLMIDSGSTTIYFARALDRHRDLLVVTNSLEIAHTVGMRKGNRVYLAGGELRADLDAALGSSAIQFVEQFRVRTTVLSAGAVDAADGVMDYELAEAEFSRVLIERAERAIVIADRSKFGRRGLVQIQRLDAIDMLITDAPPPPPLADALRAAGVTVLTPGSDEP